MTDGSGSSSSRWTTRAAGAPRDRGTAGGYLAGSDRPGSLAVESFERAPDGGTGLFGWSVASDDRWSYLFGHCYRQFTNGQSSVAAFDPRACPTLRRPCAARRLPRPARVLDGHWMVRPRCRRPGDTSRIRQPDERPVVRRHLGLGHEDRRLVGSIVLHRPRPAPRDRGRRFAGSTSSAIAGATSAETTGRPCCRGSTRRAR